jgi:hypothetical protein
LGLKKTVQSYSYKPKRLWQRHELASPVLHGTSVGGSIVGVANRTKNAVRVMCSSGKDVQSRQLLLSHSHRYMRTIA